MSDSKEVSNPELPVLVSSEPVVMSESIGKLALALSKAQGEIGNAHKDSTNPFYKSNYADLASCWDAAREALSKNELAVIQTHSVCGKGDVVLTTILAHSSGQFIKGTISIRPTKNDPQMYVSATTYGRRCGFSAIVGISPGEDDGNAISGKTKTQVSKPAPASKGKPAPASKGKPVSKGKPASKPASKGKPAPVDNGDDEF
jgi:hypothetical protein